jgi:hypothetical protein
VCFTRGDEVAGTATLELAGLKRMPEYCTCGAQLPPDALFCHKCGKPQREIIAPDIEANVYSTAPAVAAPVIPPPARPPVPLNFHNRVAVRTALLAAVGATVLVVLLPLNWLGAGFFAVYLYCRRTGFRLDVASGVKIGWITGLIAYGFYAILFTARLMPDMVSGNLGKALLEQMKSSALQDPAKVQEAAKIAADNPGLVVFLLLGMLFVLVTCLSMAGGALGAKLVGSSK